MLIKELQPFNLDLLILNKNQIEQMSEIEHLGIFISNSKMFHSKGLYSTDIFGPVGSEERSNNFGYINLHTNILHPLLYKNLIKLRRLYKDIMSSTKYAIWDKSISDFVESNVSVGETGYNFFIKHYKNIKFNETDSDIRDYMIKLMDKYKSRSLIDHLLVLPAGLRDYYVDDNGKPSVDEINNIYKKILSTAKSLTMLPKIDDVIDDELVYRLQVVVYELYEYIRVVIFDGKSKFLQANWAKRAVFNGTRNVITALPTNTTSPTDPRTLKFNETAVNLYQYLKAIQPIAIHRIKSNMMNLVFDEHSLEAKLIDPKTMLSSIHTVGILEKEKWFTSKGLEEVLTTYSQNLIRHTHVTIDGMYPFLIYLGNDATFKIITDINLTPEHIDRKLIRPITLTELLYLSIFELVGKYPCTVTRDPITGLGSTYPSKVHLITTVNNEIRYELDENWNKTDVVANSFPIAGESFFNSLSPHYSRLARLGADFDGDACSFIMYYTEESIAEIEDLLNKPEQYIGPDGKVTNSISNDVLNMTLAYMRG